ncbi:Calvin cycle protein CP12 [Planktothricoides sp. SR001]|uniref:Calvin cycle protein CP12 n=1 Tax=Planktothricoides sp. SR001 TaxID=1705388 RepID=UPI0009E7807A|nr:Calvin cycle protein CP12 [Planktothricoides sp. SR001]
MIQVLATKPQEVGVNLINEPLERNFEQERTRRLEANIQAAIAEARAISQQKGVTSRESAVAWDIVEELQAAACHRREQKQKTPFDRYCEENPSAIEALIYDL